MSHFQQSFDQPVDLGNLWEAMIFSSSTSQIPQLPQDFDAYQTFPSITAESDFRVRILNFRAKVTYFKRRGSRSN